MAGVQKTSYLATANDDMTSGGDRARLHQIIVGTLAASAVVTVYEGTSTSGTVKAVINAAAEKECNFKGAWFPGGLYIKLTGGNAKVSVLWD